MTIIECLHYFFCVPALPRVVITDLIPNPRVKEPFFIECTVAGIPLPTISWMKDGAPLEGTADDNLRILAIPIRNASRVEVTVSNVDFNGVYQCLAKNLAGNDSRSLRIELQG